MIALSSDFMLFELGSGESVPFSADMITVELTGGTTSLFDADFVKHAAKAVFHYFRQELRRETVTMAEFAESIEKVLKGFALSVDSRLRPEPAVAESDLSRLASESGKGCELFFFPRLRDEVRDQLRTRPRLLHFRGLRRCVKQLIGARRWTPRCRSLQEQIVEYLREIASVEAGTGEFALRVD